MPDRNKNRNGARPEYEVAYYTKELGKALQREMLQQQLARLSDGTARISQAGNPAVPDPSAAPPASERVD